MVIIVGSSAAVLVPSDSSNILFIIQMWHHVASIYIRT